MTVYAGCVWTIGQTGEKISAFKTKTDTCGRDLKVMLHQTIRNDDFKRNTALQCWNDVGTIRNNVATMLQSFVALKIVVANRYV